MMRMDGDIVPLLLACARGDLSKAPVPNFSGDTVICVVLAAKGYPDSPLEGSIIRGAEQDFGNLVAHAASSPSDSRRR